MNNNFTSNHILRTKRRGSGRPRRGTQILEVLRMPSGQIVFIRTKHRGA